MDNYYKIKPTPVMVHVTTQLFTKLVTVLFQYQSFVWFGHWPLDLMNSIIKILSHSSLLDHDLCSCIFLIQVFAGVFVISFDHWSEHNTRYMCMQCDKHVRSSFAIILLFTNANEFYIISNTILKSKKATNDST